MTATRPVAPPTTERSATTRIDRAASGDVVTSYKNAPTRTVSAGGVDFAYRELGPRAGVPAIFLTHLAAVLDTGTPESSMASARSSGSLPSTTGASVLPARVPLAATASRT